MDQAAFNIKVAEQLGSLDAKMDEVLTRTSSLTAVKKKVDQHDRDLKIARWAGGTVGGGALTTLGVWLMKIITAAGPHK